MRQAPIGLGDLAHLENFTVLEFCAWARISRATAYRAMREGALTAVKLRGRTIIRRQDAVAFVGAAAA